MAKQNSEEKPSAKNEAVTGSASQKATGKSGSNVTAILALLLAVGALGFSAYQWKMNQEQSGGFASTTSGLEQRVTDATENLEKTRKNISQDIEAVHKQKLEQARQIVELENKIEQTQQQFLQLREEMGKSETGWLVTEAQYLLNLANHQLELKRDIDTAYAALKAADERLLSTGDPVFIKVREQIQNEMAALRAVVRPDITGMVLELRALQKQVNRLPLQAVQYDAGEKVTSVTDSTEAQAENSDWKQKLLQIWNEVRDTMMTAVTIRRNDEPVKPMLAPEHEFFLYKNLELKLENAQLALLKVDRELFDTSLDLMNDWLVEYFDTDKETTQNALNTIAHLKEQSIEMQLPDISGSLRLLREESKRLKYNNTSAEPDAPVTEENSDTAAEPASEPSDS